MKWSDLKHLNNLYAEEYTNKSFFNTSFGKRLFEMELINKPYKSTISKKEGFDDIYKKNYKQDYDFALSIITKYDLFNTNFSFSELKALKELEIFYKNNKTNNVTLKEIGSIFFKGSKKIKKNSKLYKAILSVLNVEYLAEDEHDQQYLWILHCKSKNPTSIIICENSNLLRKKRFEKTELWYAGGKNINKLKYVNLPNIPIYYLCDWDNDGIEIYYKVKKIISKLILIIPKKNIKYKSTKDHIEWKIDIIKEHFSNEAFELLNNLIKNDKWIEEESIKLDFE